MLVLHILLIFPKILPTSTLEIDTIMILKRLKIKGFKPYFEEQTLEIEPDVTVITGSNDVGKSALLNILYRVAPGIDRHMVNEEDVNEDMIWQLGGPWNHVRDIYVIATYGLGDESNQPELYDGELDTKWPASPMILNVAEVRDNSGNQVDLPSFQPKAYSHTIDLGISERIRPVLEQGSIHPVEHAFLAYAFRSDDVWNELESLSPRVQNQRRDQANERLNAGLASYKPESLHVDLSLDFESRKPVKFLVGVKDRYGGFAGPHLRGGGYQKLLALMFRLLMLTAQLNDFSSLILLLDEPENSLHPYAQRSFRQLLERFAENPLIQVIYATHSPAMINPARPKSLRLLSRDRSAEKVATTKINNKPYSDYSFQLIRSSLGMSPADSLLYAPITIIIEGATESLGLNRLFQRLIDESEVERYKDLETLVGLVHFLSAGGSSFARWARIAKSQGNLVIVFVDGDHINRANQLQKEYPEIPVVHFYETKEFEDIVPRETYFQALADYAAENGADTSISISEDNFNQWEVDQEFNERVLFSKRVAKWYKKHFSYDMEKAEVVDRAIEIAKLDEMDLSKIDELIEAIRQAADNPY